MLLTPEKEKNSFIYIFIHVCVHTHARTHTYTQVCTYIQRNLSKTELLLQENLLLLESPVSIRGNHCKVASNKWRIIKGGAKKKT